ncbi:MAG TPA: hypothetical protein VFE37_02105 [Chloroflexota bacterium]|nr:hypothetical protein [Chloroflexota bacterium]
MSVKDEIHTLVEQLTDDAAADVLDYLHWLTTDIETLSEEQLARVQRGEAQIARGEYITLAELRRLRGE